MGFMTIEQIKAEVLRGIGNHDVEQLAIAGAAENDGRDRIYRYINETMLEIAQLRLTQGPRTGTIYRHRELEETFTQPIYGNTDTDTSVWPIRAYAPNAWSLGYQNPIKVPTLGIISVRLYDPDDYSHGWRLTPVRDRDEFDRRSRRAGQPRQYGVFAAKADDWSGGQPPAFADAHGTILLTPPPSMDFDGWTLEVRRWRFPRLISEGYESLDPDTDVLDFGQQWDESVHIGATARAFWGLQLNKLGDDAYKRFQALTMDVALRHQLDAEDLDFGPPIELGTPYMMGRGYR